MSFIEWQDNFSVGVSQFDEQHKKLVELVNKLYDAMKRGEGKAVLSFILKELVDYTETHFTSEEVLMKKYNYPELIKHAQEHVKLKEDVQNFQEKYNNGTVLLSIEIMNFLKDWLAHHILESDMKYKDFFIGKGIK